MAMNFTEVKEMRKTVVYAYIQKNYELPETRREPTSGLMCVYLKTIMHSKTIQKQAFFRCLQGHSDSFFALIISIANEFLEFLLS